VFAEKLISERCYLSPIDTGDAELVWNVVKWLNDHSVVIHLNEYGRNVTIDYCLDLLENLSQNCGFVIVSSENSIPIGLCYLDKVDKVNQSAELTVFIGEKSFWGGGFGTTAVGLLVDYGFRALNLYNIYLEVFEMNKRAIQCFERVGFKRIGVRRKSLVRNFKRFDIVLMDVLRKDFYKSE
jgi:RimJ/RimL family protein N-acetyltransferase